MRRSISHFLIALSLTACLPAALAAGPPLPQRAENPRIQYDGKWWLSLDADAQAGFLNGASDCLTWVAHEPWLTHSIAQLEKKIAAYYKAHPESIALPVFEIWQKLLREIPPTKPLEGGEVWTNPHGYYDGLYWRQDSDSGNRGFLEGYLLCLRTRVKSPTESYSRPVSYYAAKINAYLKAHPKAVDDPIADILSRFRDGQGKRTGAATGDAAAARVGQGEKPRLTQFNVVDSVEGFEVPGIKEVVGWGPRAEVTQADAPKGLFRGEARFEKPPSAFAVFYLFDPGTRYIKAERHRIRVDSLKRYDLNGKVFCYSVEATSEFYDPATRRGGYGPKWELRYLDLDGDGRFERMQLGDFSIHPVPGWATSGAPIP